jgi:hypothetical protein
VRIASESTTRAFRTPGRKRHEQHHASDSETAAHSGKDARVSLMGLGFISRALVFDLGSLRFGFPFGTFAQELEGACRE